MSWLKTLLTRLRAWWHADLYERIDALKAKPPEHPETVQCPVCRKAYDLSHIPARVDQLSLVCNNRLCGEHMEVRRTNGRWHAEYRTGDF